MSPDGKLGDVVGDAAGVLRSLEPVGLLLADSCVGHPTPNGIEVVLCELKLLGGNRDVAS